MKYKKKEFAEKHGLTCGKHCVWGVYEGYHVHIKYTPVGNPRCLITVVTAAGGKEKSLEKYLGAQKNKLNISNFGVVKLGLMVCPKFTGEVFARAEHILDEICAHLKKAGFAGADVCPYCGAAIKEGGVLATESDIPFRVHEGCYEAALAGAREKDRLNAEKPDRKALGMLGGFLGALFGAVVFVLTYAWWGFGSLGAAAGILLGHFLYRKLGGKNTLFCAVYCIAAALILSFAGHLFGLFMDARAAGGGWSTLFDAPLSGGKAAALFIANIACNLLLTAAGGVYAVYSYLKDRRTIADKMRRLDG